MYAFAASVVETVSIGYGIDGLQRTVGAKRKKNVASALTVKSGSKIIYYKTNTSPSPAISIKSLPELGNAVTEQPENMTNDKLGLEEEVEPIAIRTTSKKMFR